MKPYFVFVLSLTIISTTFACHAMNGISKKAILLGLERSTQATEVVRHGPSPDTSEPGEMIENEIFENDSNHSTDMMANGNSSKKSNSSEPGGILGSARSSSIEASLGQPQNISKPIRAQPQAQATEYIGFKNLNISYLNDHLPENSSTVLETGASSDLELPAELASLVNYGSRIPARLMQEQGLVVDEPAVKTANTTELKVMQMKPPISENITSSDPAVTADASVNNDWGGDCGVKDWKRCNNITVVGAETVVNPDFPWDPKKNIMTQFDCFDSMKAADFPWLCLKNGWTVNRCHILCMSKCNRELLRTRNFDLYVLHEGACKTK